MSDADEVMKESTAVESVANSLVNSAADTAIADAARAPLAAEANMLDSMEEATLDDLLRDISSMTDSAMQPLTVSMVVEVDDARREDEFGGGVDVKRDEEDELMKQLDLVLDDKFYGGKQESSR